MSASSWTTLGVLFLSLLVDRQCSGLQCYVGIGHKISNGSQLRAVDCATRDAVSSNTTRTSSPSDKVTTNCIIFYNPITDEAEFACDHDSVCTVARGTQTTSACYKKTRGSLRCCQGDLCNADSTNLYHMSPPQSSTTCYSGTNSEGSTNTVEVNCPTSWCYIELLRQHGRIINQTFGCDSQCDSSHSPPTVKSCSEKLVSTDGLGLTQRRCICSLDRCNSNIDLILPEASTPSPSTTTIPLHLSMHNPDHGIQSSRSMVRVIVPVGTGIIALLIIVLLAIVVVRYREHRAKSLTFTYTQLTADLAEDPPQIDDDRLLIP